MNVQETISKLRKLTVANGATPAEERAAAGKIGKLLMSHPEMCVGDRVTGEKPTLQGMRHYGPSGFGAPLGGWDTWIRAHARTYEE